jgi:hypothetical protein
MESAADQLRPIGESGRALERDTRELIGAIEQLATSAGGALRDQIHSRPYATLGAGLVGGYILGGGLTVRLATFLLAAGGRATLTQMLAGGLAAAGAGRATRARAGRQS